MCSFNLLPNDIFPLVFSHLSIKDLGRAAQVSKMFNEIQNKSELWENILKKIPKKPDHSVESSFYSNSKEKVRNVVINLSLMRIFFNGNFCATIKVYKKNTNRGIRTNENLVKEVIPYFPNFHKNYYIALSQRMNEIIKRDYIYYDNNNQFQCETTYSYESSAIEMDLVKNRKKIKWTV